MSMYESILSMFVRTIKNENEMSIKKNELTNYVFAKLVKKKAEIIKLNRRKKRKKKKKQQQQNMIIHFFSCARS